jgi:DNA-binding beta-propeller fold protein YncE
MVLHSAASRAFLIAASCLVCLPILCPAEEPTFAPVPEFAAAVGRHDVGPCSAVAVNRHGEIILAHRGKRPVMCLDAQGALLRSWGNDVVKTAHGVRVDGQDNVWLTDIGTHRVFQFSRDGKLLLALGTGQPGAGDDEFDRPTDVAFGKNGDFYVTDGYGNSRVLQFNKDGKRIGSWGTRGKGEAEFHLPHALLVDRAGRVLVGDRENNRVQIFDQDAKFVKAWNGFAPYGLAFDPAGRVWVADARAHQVLELDAEGKVVRRMGEKGTDPGQFMTPHMLEFDASGDLYVAEVDGRRLQKFVRKAN